MKKNILLIVSLVFASFMNAAVSKTVNVTTAGTLRTLFTTTEMTTVTNLTITGSIDARDFKFMRDGITNLAVLDISTVSVQGYSGTGGTSTEVFYPANEIPAIAFNFCYGLTIITIPNSVTSIGSNAFYGCYRLTSLIIPNSVTTLGGGTFLDCSGLTNITISNSITSIGNSDFGSCSGLTSITIPNSVTAIGNGAFYGCSGLISITIPNSVTSIGDYAFYRCSKLTSLYVYATTPVDLSLSPNVFAFVNTYACTLYVPTDSKSAYQAAPIWGDFNIVEMAPTALPTMMSESVNIYPNPVTDGFLINGLEGSGTLTLTDLSGKELLTKQVKVNEYVSVGFLPKGIYIVKIATEKGTIERKVLKK